MDTNVNYTIVGAFVILLVTAAVLIIIWLSAGFSLQHYSTYMVYMQESVSGLSIDAPVEYNGVSVGTVSSIELNHKNPHLVEVLLSIKNNTLITRGTVATVNSRGLTGIAFISLKDNSSDLTPLVAENGMPYPVIRTAPSLFQRWDTALSKLSKSIVEASESFQAVLSPENQHAIRQTLINLQDLTSNLAAQNQKFNTILDNTAHASAQFGPTLEAGRGAMQMLQTQTLPQTNRIIMNFDTISRNLLDVTNELKQNPAVLIRGKQPPPLGPGEK
jgi:phospholipid/cholesterol/gamma-HCH transport system substrate-binding protein